MKIVELIFSVCPGGAERFVVDLCNELANDENNEVILLTVCDDRLANNVYYSSDISNRVRTANMHQSKGLSLTSLWAIYHFLRREKPDVVHCHSILLLIYLPILFVRSRYFHTLHSTAEFCLRFKVLKRINHFLYKHKVQPVTISKECSLSYRKLYGLQNDIVIVNGRRKLQSWDIMPEDMMKSTDGFSFIHLANCRPMKNQERLFRVFCRLKGEGVAFDLFCLGSGYDEYAKRFAADGQIHILGVKRDVSHCLSFADFMVMTSDFEGMPISILEGMSLGVVPISTPAGGIKDMIRDGENGYMTDGFDDEEFYQKVKQAIKEFGKISRKALIEEFDEKYSIEICAERYCKLYHAGPSGKN